jgi:hypothetical protein
VALLLKVQAEALKDGLAVVPRMKSATLVAEDTGETVYVWLGDHGGKGALNAIASLTAFEEITVPQVRDPSKKKHAYRLTLAATEAQLFRPLGTDDLGPSHHVEGADGIDSLGRIHRDPNDKIIRLTSAEAAVLHERFRH